MTAAGISAAMSLIGLKPLRTHEYVGKSLVDVVDWTVKGAVTPVKNREQCDSCWAFLITSILEGSQRAVFERATARGP